MEKLGLNKEEVLKDLMPEVDNPPAPGMFGVKAEESLRNGNFGKQAEKSWFRLKAEEELVQETLMVII